MFRKTNGFAPNHTDNDIAAQLANMSTEGKVGLGEKYKRVAMFLLENPAYQSVLGGYDKTACDMFTSGSYYAKNLTSEHESRISGRYYVRLALAHDEARSYILQHMQDKLNPADVVELTIPSNKLK